MYAEAIEYEFLTQAIYQAILVEEGQRNIKVQRDINQVGRSGVSHQIDVLWQFKQAGVLHTVLVECKNFSSSITLEKVRNLFAVAHDIGNCHAIMVTKTGYQEGAFKFANHYGIHLKLFRKPTQADWKGRVKDIILRIKAKMPVSTDERPIRVDSFFSPASTEQEKKLRKHFSLGTLYVPSGPDVLFLNADGVPATEEMRWWLPKQLDVLDKEPGGPYEQSIPLDDKYLLVSMGDKHQELIRVGGLKVTYYVEQEDLSEIAIYGDQTVRAILKDFATGETEHVLRDR